MPSLALQVDQQVEDLGRAPKRRAPRPPRRARSAPAWSRCARAIATRWRWPPEISWMARPASWRRGRRVRAARRSPRGRSAAVGDAVDAQRIGEHAGDGGARVEGGERVLEHHLHPRAHARAASRRAAPARSSPPKRIAAGVGLDEAQDDARQRRLAAARGPDQAERLAARDGDRDVVERGDAAAAARKASWQMPVAASSGALMPAPPRSAAACRGRYGGEQQARVGLARRAERLGGGADLDQPRLAEHGDAVGEAGGQRDVVA